jgi:glycosyltransferase involved in cell wall biosynthesis
MHIGFIWVPPAKSPIGLDPRVLKEIGSLGEEGFRISVLSSRLHDGQPETEALTPTITIYRKIIQEPSIFSKAWTSWTLHFPAWKPVIEEFVLNCGIDVLHVCDLPMLRTTLSVARRRAIPVVADFFENWPAAVESYRGDRSRLFQALMTISRGQFLYRRFERQSARECEGVVVVVPEAIDRFLKAGVPQKSVVVVSNTEDETTLQIPKINLKSDEFDLFRDRWVAIYHGSVGAHRGLDTAIRGVKEITKHVPNFLMTILGAHGEWGDKLKRMAGALGIENHVTIRGWTPYETCLRYVLASQVGLVPHNDFEHTQTTVPHKLFQYMLCARPVVVSDCRPLKRIVEAAGAGPVFRASDSQDFARTIVRLALDPELCRRYGASGRKAATTIFSWKHDAARLVAMYREIANRNASHRSP